LLFDICCSSLKISVSSVLSLNSMMKAIWSEEDFANLLQYKDRNAIMPAKYSSTVTIIIVERLILILFLGEF
jgi:hypothetical protein